ncbi:hypothetical protein ACIA2T_16220 [Amycolatopsis japonica]|uniref:hypothetical protein n=1 Tax=Amycolatopsis japonica TaxID=208439 RepID=UPI003793B893
MDTTIRRLGDETGMPIAAVRASLMYRFDVAVLRQETPVARGDLDGPADHARIASSSAGDLRNLARPGRER